MVLEDDKEVVCPYCDRVWGNRNGELVFCCLHCGTSWKIQPAKRARVRVSKVGLWRELEELEDAGEIAEKF